MPVSATSRQARDTVAVAATQQLVVIMRGTPGSGKSYLAGLVHKTALEHGYSSVICSADDFFMVDGKYNFSTAKLVRAMQQQQQQLR